MLSTLTMALPGLTSGIWCKYQRKVTAGTAPPPSTVFYKKKIFFLPEWGWGWGWV